MQHQAIPNAIDDIMSLISETETKVRKEMQMQETKTDLHNQSVMREFHAYITDPSITVLTHHEILCAIADIVAKRKQPESGTIDLHTGLRY